MVSAGCSSVRNGTLWTRATLEWSSDVSDIPSHIFFLLLRMACSYIDALFEPGGRVQRHGWQVSLHPVADRKCTWDFQRHRGHVKFYLSFTPRDDTFTCMASFFLLRMHFFSLLWSPPTSMSPPFLSGFKSLYLWTLNSSLSSIYFVWYSYPIYTLCCGIFIGM